MTPQFRISGDFETLRISANMHDVPAAVSICLTDLRICADRLPVTAPQAVRLGYLDDQEVTILVARLRDPQAKRWYAKFHGWLSDRPDLFETIYEDAEYLLTRVCRERISILDD